MIVGGGRRGVVATACYVARTYGVRSAMPMFKALKACPDAVVIRPDIDKYARVGREVRRLMLELTPLVEPVSIDEAFLDLSGTERLHGASPAVTLARFARRIETEIGITVSVGLSCNKFLAKIASDLDKPRGFSVIGRAEAAAFLADRPVDDHPRHRRGRAGAAGQSRHHHDPPPARGARREPCRARPRRGAPAPARRAARTTGSVSPARETKSVSAETTFEHDLTAFEDLRPILWRLCERVALRLKRADLAGRSVTLKLKDAAFRLRTRTRSGLPATQLAGRLFEPAQALLREECKEKLRAVQDRRGAAFRLIGIAAADLCAGAEADRGDLADSDVRREAQREAALDRIRERFGRDAVQKGLAFRR